MDIPLNMSKTEFLASEGKSRAHPTKKQRSSPNYGRTQEGHFHQGNAEGKWLSAQQHKPVPRVTPADARLQAKWPKVCEVVALPQTAAVKYLGMMFQADLSRQPAEAKVKKLFEQFCRVALSIPKSKPWNLQELKAYVQEHVYSRMEYQCTSYPLDEIFMRELDTYLGQVLSAILAHNKISAGNFSATAALTYLGLPLPSDRAKTAFASQTVVMLRRADIHGQLARARFTSHRRGTSSATRKTIAQ